MKAIVHTYYTTDTPVWKKIGDLSSRMTRRWCEAHGYEFRIHTKRIWPAAGVTWGKIKILEDSCRAEPYSLHIFIDADIFITDPSQSLEDLLELHEDALLCTGSDWVFPLNTGFMAAKRECLFLLEKLSQLRFSSPFGFFEQGTLQLIRQLSNFWEKSIRPLPHDRVNSYPPNITENWIGTWKPDSFLCHFAGWKKDKIVEFLQPAFSLDAEKAREVIHERLESTALRISEYKSKNLQKNAKSQ